MVFHDLIHDLIHENFCHAKIEPSIKISVEANNMQEYLIRILQSCYESNSITPVRIVHANVIKTNSRTIVVLNTLLNVYLRLGFTTEAQKLFDQIPRRNTCSWTAMISGYAKLGFYQSSFDLFRQMHYSGAQPNQFTYASVISACSDSGSPWQAIQMHLAVLKSGFSADTVIQNALIHTYIGFGYLEDAMHVFEEMPMRDSVSWTSIIAGHAKHGQVKEAMELYGKAQVKTITMWNALISGFTHSGFGGLGLDLFCRMDFNPNSVTLASVISACAELRDLEKGLQIHGKIVVDGLDSESTLVNGLMDLYSKCGETEMAVSLFHKSCCRNLISWNVILGAYVQNGHVDKALEMFQCMPARDTVSWNTVVAGLAMEGFMDKAMHIFVEIPQKTVASWNAMIAGYASNGYDGEALEMFRQMVFAGENPDAKTISSVLSSCALEEGMEIHGKLVVKEVQVDTLVMNALVDLYARNGELNSACWIFDRMLEHDAASWNVLISGYTCTGLIEEALQMFHKMPDPDVVSWNVIISGLVQVGRGSEAVGYFKKMLMTGMKPDSDTCCAILPMGCLNYGMEIHLKIISSVVASDVFVMTAIVDMYINLGFLSTAWKLFQKMNEKDLVAWNVIISGFAQQGIIEHAILLFHKMPQRNQISWNAVLAGLVHGEWCDQVTKIFRQMQMESVPPDSTTFILLASACTKLSALDEGRRIHEIVLREGFSEYAMIMNTFIDMYAKCGSIQEAYSAFKKVKDKHVSTWNVMIGGYAVNGYSNEALKCYEEMKQLGVTPDHVTFLNILLACSHGGLVAQGYHIFHDMKTVYGFLPAREHYLCLIDLLGRVGSLEEAVTVTNLMSANFDVTM